MLKLKEIFTSSYLSQFYDPSLTTKIQLSSNYGVGIFKKNKIMMAKDYQLPFHRNTYQAKLQSSTERTFEYRFF